MNGLMMIDVDRFTSVEEEWSQFRDVGVMETPQGV